MKKIYKSIVFVFAAAAVIGCAKMVSESTNQANKRFLEAWMSVNHPGKAPSGLGIYILENHDGDGITVEKDGYAIVEFTETTLEGDITSYSNMEVAMQMGVYDSTAYYGPRVWLTANETIQAGLQDALLGMKVEVAEQSSYHHG